MPLYVLPTVVLPATAAGPAPEQPAHLALDRAYESIAVLCEELEKTQRELAAKNSELAETPDGVTAERFEAMRADRDYWRDTVATKQTLLIRTAAERDEAQHELADLKRYLAELSGVAV